MHPAREPLAAAIALAFAGGAHAQQGTGATPQTLPPTVVTANAARVRARLSSVEPVNVLQGQGLRLKQQPTIGETLASEVGVSATYFGPNASRPIIRGLGTFDIRMLNNGLAIVDASAASPDHAVAVSPFAAERVEVVRGPATVMYGGNAIGGVVNAIDGRIAQEGLATPVDGAADYRYGGANDLSAGGLRVNAGNQAFVLHVDGYATKNKDLRDPRQRVDRGGAGPARRARPVEPAAEQPGRFGHLRHRRIGHAGRQGLRRRLVLAVQHPLWHGRGARRDDQTEAGLLELRRRAARHDSRPQRAARQVRLQRLSAHRVRGQRGRHRVQVERLQPACRGRPSAARPVHRRDRSRGRELQVLGARRRSVPAEYEDERRGGLLLRGAALRAMEVLLRAGGWRMSRSMRTSSPLPASRPTRAALRRGARRPARSMRSTRSGGWAGTFRTRSARRRTRSSTPMARTSRPTRSKSAIAISAP